MRIHVIGNVTLDVFLRVPHFPHPGETLLAGASYWDCGGKGANQAVAACRTGAKVRFFFAIGDDVDAERILSLLRQENLDLHPLVRTDLPTDKSFIFVRDDGDNAIVSTADCASSVRPEDLEQFLTEVLQAETVLLQGNLSTETTEYALKQAKERGAVTVLNAAPLRPDADKLISLCDVLIVNQHELLALSGAPSVNEAQVILHERGVKQLVVTLGARGALFSMQQCKAHIAAPEVEAIDTTGAGDVFSGVFTAVRLAGRDPNTALTLANQAASASVCQHGTYRAIPHLRGGAWC